MAANRKMTLIVYAPALVGDDSRPVAVVHGMEQVFPGLRLDWRVADDGRPIALPNRDAWLAEGTRGGGFALVCNGDERYPVMIYGVELPANSSPGGQAQFEVHVQMPPDAAAIAVAAGVLEAVAERACASWGHLTPSNAAGDIARQTKNWAANSQPPPRGLPSLKLPEQIRSPAIPHRLGWLNYWSAAAAEAIGFPDPSRDAELLSRARRTGTGGWVVQLTDVPLDLDNPVHLEALLRAYERFPEIGARTAP
jgi:hypothetical protein